VFSALAPRMWDSAKDASAKTTTVSGTQVDVRTGQLAESTAQAAGEKAQPARLGTTLGKGTLRLTPSHSLRRPEDVPRRSRPAQHQHHQLRGGPDHRRPRPHQHSTGNAFIVDNYSSGTTNVVLDTDGYFAP
jgi:hypothetical protein